MVSLYSTYTLLPTLDRSVWTNHARVSHNLVRTAPRPLFAVSLKWTCNLRLSY
jgi:hypothetical protein